MKSLQQTQNRLLRLLNNSKVSDKISTKSMLEQFQLLSVNQLAAEIKLIETWKSINIEGCPTELEPYNLNQADNEYRLRPQPNRIFNDTARLQLSLSSFYIDAARLWNNAPATVKSALTLNVAKKAIKEHCKSLPV